MNSGLKQLRSIFLVSFLFFASFSVAMYIDSTALEHFVDAQYTSLFFVLGATGSLLLLFVLPKIVQKYGLVKTSASILLLLAAALVTVGTTTVPLTFVTAFVCYIALTSTVWYCIDLFVAHYTDSRTAGRTRGLYLTVVNGAIALMPVIAGILVAHKGIGSVYVVAAILMTLALCIILYTQRTFVDRPYTAVTIPAAWNSIRHSPALRRILSVNFLLQFFFAWMTIFTPLYLSAVLHFSWTEIGAAFSFMLLAFVILQYGVGMIADRIGEKGMLLFGLGVTAISTIVFALLGNTHHSIIIYALVLFCTRIGAAIVEVLSESYFFKHITDQDEGIVSVFRMMRPLSFVIAPLAGWYIIAMTSYTVLFYMLGVLLFLGMIYAIRLPKII